MWSCLDNLQPLRIFLPTFCIVANSFAENDRNIKELQWSGKNCLVFWLGRKYFA